MQSGPQSKSVITPKEKHPAEMPLRFYSPFQIIHHDILAMIFSMLPKQQFLPQRLLNKRCQKIIDLQRLNRSSSQDIIQQVIQTEVEQNALLLSQQHEIDCLLVNKRAILNTPKLETQVIRPDEELIKAFKEVESLPNDNRLFSLYRRHIALNNINLHIIMNVRDFNQLYDMFTFNKVVDLSGLYLTRLSPMLFDNPNLAHFPLVLNVSNNCLTQLPCSIVHLKKLQILDLSGNSLVKLPENINEFEHLETVFLANNNLRELPVGLVTLKKLRHLDIRRNCLQVLPLELDQTKLCRPRQTSVPLRSWMIDYAQYRKQFSTICQLSKQQVLATQKPQGDLPIQVVTNAFRQIKLSCQP